jgi:ubiquinone/menaquinone biosynthesis C-methylase UbiE
VGAKNLIAAGLVAGLVMGGTYLGRRRPSSEETSAPAMTTEQVRRLLRRAVPLLRLPTSPDRSPEVMSDGCGLRCPTTGRLYPYRNGVLDLLASEVTLTETQHALNTSLTAWAYDHFRGLLMQAFGLPDFPEEVASIQEALQVRAGETLLDLACGHGIFTIEWAKRAGPEGLIIGLDISPAMLGRAAWRLRRWRLDNVLLIRGDAHTLPFADGCLPKVNCSGGFHQLPDLERALREIARVSAPGAILTASTFAERPNDRYASLKRWLKARFDLHFVPLPWLGRQLAAHGYQDYTWSLPGGGFGYTSARKTAL